MTSILIQGLQYYHFFAAEYRVGCFSLVNGPEIGTGPEYWGLLGLSGRGSLIASMGMMPLHCTILGKRTYHVKKLPEAGQEWRRRMYFSS